MGVVGNAVFGEQLGFYLVAPVDLNDGVVVGQDEQELVVEVV